ncbi:hypothetical protein [Sulfolobus tengchongensis spindle-shaped virus 4]|nr:hypothetical protein [Sulfolobus tengchongensis spindle-shaped virus 4]
MVKQKMSQPVSQTPNTGDKFEEIDEETLVRQQNIQYLARLRGLTAKKVEYVINAVERYLLNNGAIPDGIREVAKATIDVIQNAYDETVKVAEEILKNPNDMKSVVSNAIEIYANFYAINTITEDLLEKYVYRYEQLEFINPVAEKLEKIENIVTYLINENVKPYLSTPHELARLLGDIIDNIMMFYEELTEEGSGEDYMGDLLSDLREQLEDDENEIERSKYAILSDALDIIYNEYNNAVVEGNSQRYDVDELGIGTIDVCSDVEDPERYGLFCDEERDEAFKADSVDYKKLVEGMTEAYAGFKAAQLVYKILKANKIENEDFEENLADIIEKTRDIIRAMINYIVRDYATKINV